MLLSLNQLVIFRTANEKIGIYWRSTGRNFLFCLNPILLKSWVIQKFTNAIYKSQIWVANHSDAEVANSIKDFFPGTDIKLIETVIKNYREIDSIAEKPTLKEEELSKLMDIIQEYDPKLLKSRPAFDVIVNNTYAEKAIKEINK